MCLCVRDVGGGGFGDLFVCNPSPTGLSAQDTMSGKSSVVQWAVVTDADGNTKMQPLLAPSPDSNPKDLLSQLHVGSRPVSDACRDRTQWSVYTAFVRSHTWPV